MITTGKALVVAAIVESNGHGLNLSVSSDAVYHLVGRTSPITLSVEGVSYLLYCLRSISSAQSQS